MWHDMFVPISIGDTIFSVLSKCNMEEWQEERRKKKEEKHKILSRNNVVTFLCHIMYLTISVWLGYSSVANKSAPFTQKAPTFSGRRIVFMRLPSQS